MELLLQKYLSSLLIILFAASLILLVFRRMEENTGLPPGPMSWPVIGNLHQLGSKPHERLTELAKSFGDVYRLQLGSRRVIVLNSLDYVKEALVKKSNDFSSRPPLRSFKACDIGGRSVAFGPYGPTYLKNRRLAHLAMHSFLSDHERLCSQIANGLQKLCKTFAEHKDEFDPILDIKNTIAEMNFAYTFGEDIDAKDKDQLSQLLTESNQFIENNKVGNLVDFLPWLSPLFGGSVKRIQEMTQNLVNFVKKIYTEKKEKFSKKKRIGCVADALVRCYESGTSERVVALGEELDLDEENMVTVLTDIFGASVETTSTTLAWAVLYIASHPSIQERLHKELADVVGDNCITVSDKHRLPFLEATVLETLRHSTVIPLALPHYAEHETSVGPYRVPEDTVVFINLWGINHDERVFKDPLVFDPDRFIDEGGDVNRARFSSVPFSTGTRKCLGHVLAQIQLFLLLGGLLQKFKLESSGRPSLSPVFGFLLRPQPFSIRVLPRI